MLMQMMCTLRQAFGRGLFTSFKDVKLEKSEYTCNYMRSSGPGGQSVNTTDSKAEVRLKIEECKAIDQYIATNIYSRHKNLISSQNELVVRSQVHKSQSQNLQQCLQKVQKIIYQCSIVIKQREYLVMAEPLSAKERRIQDKKKKGEFKKFRGKNKFDD